MKDQKKTVAVIGAGPAGIAAALHAARLGCRVSLFDSNAQIGKKLLVTGSGRCNITNMNADAASYTCSDPALLQPLFDNLPAGELRIVLENFGILTYSTPDGWCYPLSESAQSVVSLLEANLHSRKVNVHLNTQIKDVAHLENSYQLETVSGGVHAAEKVIVCAGGKAQPHLGAKGDLFPVMKHLGHTALPLHPALAPILADMTQYSTLQGVRLDAIAKLWHERALLVETQGNMIFTAWGMNGPAVMDLSHHVARSGGKMLRLEIDLLNGKAAQLHALLANPEYQDWACRTLLTVFLPPKPAQVILKSSGVPELTPIRELRKEQMIKIIRTASRLPFSIRGVRGFEYCQMKTGGVPLDEVDPATFESKIQQGLYLAGESLDVLGPCGGFNLHFAFASGWIAGGAAGK